MTYSRARRECNIQPHLHEEDVTGCIAASDCPPEISQLRARRKGGSWDSIWSTSSNPHRRTHLRVEEERPRGIRRAGHVRRVGSDLHRLSHTVDVHDPRVRALSEGTRAEGRKKKPRIQALTPSSSAPAPAAARRRPPRGPACSR